LVVPNTIPFFKNSTNVIEPSESLAFAVNEIFAGAVNAAPLVGKVKLTTGGELGPLIVIGSDTVPVRPLLSVAVALIE